MTTTTELTPTAMKAALLTAMLELLAQGTKKATAGDIAGYSGLALSSSECGRLLMGMRVGHKLTSGQKFYLLDPERLKEIQEGLVEAAPQIISTIPDLAPEIRELNKSLDYWRRQVDQAEQIRDVTISLKRQLTKMGADRNPWDRHGTNPEIEMLRNHVRIRQQEIDETADLKAKLAAMPPLADVQAERVRVEKELANANTQLEKQHADAAELRKSRTQVDTNGATIIERRRWLRTRQTTLGQLAELMERHDPLKVAEAIERLAK